MDFWKILWNEFFSKQFGICTYTHHLYVVIEWQNILE